MNDEKEIMFHLASVAYSQILCCHLSGKTEIKPRTHQYE